MLVYGLMPVLTSTSMTSVVWCWHPCW